MKALLNPFIFCLPLITVSCSESLEKKEPYNESRELVPNPEGYKKDTFVVEQKDSAKQTYSNCNFDRYLNDPKIPKLVKTICKNGDWNLNEGDILSFLDSLKADDKDARPFYFRVVTNSYNKSDGYYSEALGNFGKTYVESNTLEFLNYFVNYPCFTKQDLHTWVNIVMLEFSIVAYNAKNRYIVDEYIKTLNKICYGCNKEQRCALDTFCKELMLKWVDYTSKLNDEK